MTSRSLLFSFEYRADRVYRASKTEAAPRQTTARWSLDVSESTEERNEANFINQSRG